MVTPSHGLMGRCGFVGAAIPARDLGRLGQQGPAAHACHAGLDHCHRRDQEGCRHEEETQEPLWVSFQ